MEEGDIVIYFGQELGRALVENVSPLTKGLQKGQWRPGVSGGKQPFFYCFLNEPIAGTLQGTSVIFFMQANIRRSDLRRANIESRLASKVGSILKLSDDKAVAQNTHFFPNIRPDVYAVYGR